MNGEKKLAIVFFHMGLGGVQRKIIDIVNYMAEGRQKNIKIDLLLNQYVAHNFVSLIENKNVNIVYKDHIWDKKIPFFIFLFYFFWKNNYDSVLSFMGFPSVYCLMIKKILFWRKMRIVVGEDVFPIGWANRIYQGGENWRDRIRNFVKRKNIVKLMGWMYPTADRVFCVSKEVITELNKDLKIPLNKLKFVRNWTMFDKNKSSINNKRKYDVILLSRLDEEKRVGMLKKFVEKCGGKLKIVVVGSGNIQDEVLKELDNLDIDFVQTIDVEPYLLNSKILLSFSSTEGLPMAFLEAMACGVVVASLDYRGITDVIDSGKNGFVAKNVDELIEIVLELLDNNKKYKLVQKMAMKDVEKRFNPKNIEVYLNELDLLS